MSETITGQTRILLAGPLGCYGDARLALGDASNAIISEKTGIIAAEICQMWCYCYGDVCKEVQPVAA